VTTRKAKVPTVSPPKLVERAVDGRFGPYGGRYVPETLMAALEELDRVHEAAKRDPSFWTELNALLKDYVGRPTPLTEAPRLGEQVGAGVVVALKREDLNHTGAHKINNTLGQAGRTRSTTRSGRPYWPAGWGSAASSPKRGRGSTGWPRPRYARGSVSTASSTWVKRTCGASA